MKYLVMLGFKAGKEWICADVAADDSELFLDVLARGIAVMRTVPRFRRPLHEAVFPVHVECFAQPDERSGRYERLQQRVDPDPDGSEADTGERIDAILAAQQLEETKKSARERWNRENPDHKM
jgi:hypothetical protein